MANATHERKRARKRSTSSFLGQSLPLVSVISASPPSARASITLLRSPLYFGLPHPAHSVTRSPFSDVFPKSHLNPRQTYFPSARAPTSSPPVSSFLPTHRAVAIVVLVRRSWKQQLRRLRLRQRWRKEKGEKEKESERRRKGKHFQRLTKPLTTFSPPFLCPFAVSSFNLVSARERPTANGASLRRVLPPSSHVSPGCSRHCRGKAVLHACMGKRGVGAWNCSAGPLGASTCSRRRRAGPQE